MDIKNEVDKIWEEKLKDELKKAGDSLINKCCEEIELKLNNFQIKLTENLDDIFKTAEKKILIGKMNKLTKNLIFGKDNNLLNAIFLCLSNIEPFVFFCLSSEKNDILKKINELNQNNYFSLVVDLMRNLWLKKEDENNKYSTNLIHDKLNIDFPNIDICKNPGKIIAFVLTKLNNEFNLNKQLNANNNINHANIDEALNDFKKICDTNINKITKEFFVDYLIKKKCINYEVEKYFFEQRPLINLFIQEESNLTNIGKGLFTDLYLNDNFNFLLNDNIDIAEDCEICTFKHFFIINNSIQSLKNNILIINLDRDKDPLLERNIVFPLHLKLSYKENEAENYKLISVLHKINNFNEEKYIVYSKKLFNDNWIEYNEEEIKHVKDENVIINGQKALLLIYKKEDY